MYFSEIPVYQQPRPYQTRHDPVCLEVVARVILDVGRISKILKDLLAAEAEKTVSGEEVIVVHWLPN